MNEQNDIPTNPHDVGPPPGDELDALLRAWHQENADRAAAGRDKLVDPLLVRRIVARTAVP